MSWRRVQKISGILIALFLVQHLIEVLATRLIHTEIDTNTFWAAAAMRPTWPGRWLAIASVPLSAGIVVGFTGVWHPLELPEAYETYLASYWVGFGR